MNDNLEKQEKPDPERPVKFERHWQSFAAAGMLMLLGWMAYTTAQNDKKMDSFRDLVIYQMGELKDQIRGLQNLTLDRITKTEAQREIDKLDFKIRENRAAIDALRAQQFSQGGIPK